MIEKILIEISSLDPILILGVLFFFSYIENIFPPSPSDVVVFFGAVLITGGKGNINFVPVLALTTLGSALGFSTMYFIGKYLGEKIVRTGKIKFITPEALKKSDEWFARYGYILVVINRFLPGMRAVISFFCGFAELDFYRTFLFATISSALWNLCLILAGMFIGKNVELFDYYFETYSTIVTIIIAALIVAFFIKVLLNKKNDKKN